MPERPAEFAVLLPAYQAEATLPAVLAGLKRWLPGAPVLVLDDGSRDGTAGAARQAGAEVFSHGSNQGKGAALDQGYRILHRRGHRAVLSLDADGQHDPALAPELTETFREGAFDLLVGDRSQGFAAMPADRRLSNRLSTALLARACGLPLRDSQCGYRVLRLEAWRPLALRGRRFDYESELLLGLARAGGRIGQWPVPVCAGGAGSHVRRLGDTLRFLRVLAARPRGTDFDEDGSDEER
jgi:glycosyltransferase involved in cell wall biosynthesis